MKQYGMNQATEFSKKQIGVIFAAAKRGDITVERWYMSRMYDMADFYGMDENGSIAEEEQAIKRILDAVFAHDYETAQIRIDAETAHRFSLMSSKLQAKASHALVA